MESAKSRHEPDLLAMVAAIVSSYVKHHHLASAELPALITATCRALASAPGGGAMEPLAPAVPIDHSVHQTHITCLDCGLEVQMLKRHLRTAHGLSPEQYRARWSLPRDYPLVAPDLAKRRARIANALGLGTLGRGSKSGERRTGAHRTG